MTAPCTLYSGHTSALRLPSSTHSSGRSLYLMTSGCTQHSGDFAEAHPGAVGGGGGRADRPLVTVVEEGVGGAVGEGERAGAAPAQFQQAAERVRGRAADRA